MSGRDIYEKLHQELWWYRTPVYQGLLWFLDDFNDIMDLSIHTNFAITKSSMISIVQFMMAGILFLIFYSLSTVCDCISVYISSWDDTYFWCTIIWNRLHICSCYRHKASQEIRIFLWIQVFTCAFMHGIIARYKIYHYFVIDYHCILDFL